MGLRGGISYPYVVKRKAATGDENTTGKLIHSTFRFVSLSHSLENDYSHFVQAAPLIPSKAW